MPSAYGQLLDRVSQHESVLLHIIVEQVDFALDGNVSVDSQEGNDSQKNQPHNFYCQFHIIPR